MNVRVVVADEREANFFDLTTPQADLQARESFHNEAARPDRQLETASAAPTAIADTASMASAARSGTSWSSSHCRWRAISIAPARGTSSIDWC
jgi:hypothetical protein